MSIRYKVILDLFLVILGISIFTGCGGGSGNDAPQPQTSAPIITTQPASQTVEAGQTATFTVTATGTAPLGYQWMKNDTAISGATAASYTTPAATLSNNGDKFTVVVQNGVGSVTSNQATLTVNAGNLVNQITQYGITWTFNKAYPTGQFVNGDYWVVGPIIITSVNPPPVTANGNHLNGSMINPPNGSQAYDSQTEYYGHPYKPALSVSFPATIPVNSSLVSTISVLPTADDPHPRPSVKGASVLTILTEPPPAGSFRPGLIGTNKKLYNVNNIDWTKLPNLAPTASIPGAPAIANNYTRWLARPWLLHGTSWLHRHIMPEDNSPSYHRDVAMLLDEAAVLCITNWGDRTGLVINYIQVAIDYYAMQQNGRITGIQGAYNYRWPTIFAGIMLGDTDMRDMWVHHAFSTPSYHQNHLYYYANSLRTVKSSILPVGDTWTLYHQRTGKTPVFWDDANHQHSDYGYHEELTPAEWYDNDKMPQNAFGTDQPGLKQEGYRQMHSASIPGFALAAYSFNAGSYFDFPEYFGYADRWMYETVAVITASGCGPQTPYTVQTSYNIFVDEMWFKHRNDY